MKPDDIGPLKEYLAMVIAYIIDTRTSMNRPPYMALMSNIKNVLAKDVDEALAEMTEEGLLTECRTLNEKAFEFTPPKQSILKQQHR